MKKIFLKSMIILLTVVGFASLSNAQCPTITCPSNITVNNDSGTCGAVVNFTPPVGTNPCGTGSQTFNYTGAMQTWTVPAGITSITIDAYGAQGSPGIGGNAGIGGLGGNAVGTLTVIPSQIINIYVGGQSGYNGGGNPGTGGPNTSGFGGGASDVRVGSTNLTDRVIVAAGGGGGGGDNQGSCIGSPSGSGGNGGGLTGVTGTNDVGCGAGPTGGSGGTQIIGGNGGNGNSNCSVTGDNGINGVLGNGGNGGNGIQGCGGYTGAGGGGGGGGFYGGGGGGGAAGGGGGAWGGGGGGGGSSYLGGVTGGTTTSGVQSGDGQVIISWTGGATTTTQTAGLPSGSIFPVGTTTQTFTVTDQLLNTASCSFTVTVTDNEAPLPDVANLPDLTDECSVTAIPPTATDNCSGAITATTTDPTTYNTQGNFTINWSYDDGNGNITTQTQNVIIDDVTPPTFTCPTDFTTCAGTPLSIAPSTVTDNCGAVAVTYTLAGATTASGVDDASGEVFNPGVTTVTYTFDDGNGNTANCGFDVTINTVDTSVTVNNFTLTANATGTYQWYNCGTSANIPGETNASYTATVNGSYAVIVTQNGCTDTSSCHIINGIGIEEISTKGFTLYPNPATDKITLSSSSNELTLVSIYDVQNKLMLQTQFKNTKQIDVSKLAKGIYLLRIQSQEKEVNTKLVIQ